MTFNLGMKTNSAGRSTLWLALMLLLACSRSYADPLYWNDSTQNDDWDTAGNWTDPYNAAHVPGAYEYVYFNAPDQGQASPVVTFADANNKLYNLIFENNGDNYTLGTVGGTNGLDFISNYPLGIFMEANLIGSGGETINAPIESSGPLVLSNFSPTANVESEVAGVNGYDNTLTIAGSMQVDSNGTYVIGDGNVNITGGLSGPTNFNQDSDATTTFSGDNDYTGYTTVGGTLVLDNTVDNSDKLSEGIEGKNAALIMGTNGNGGHLVINGNEAGTAEVLGGLDATKNDAPYSGSLQIQGGTNSIVLNGSTDGGDATTLAMGTLSAYSGTTVDLTANGNAAFYTTSTNNNQNSKQINILGQYVTYDKTYWAQASSTSVSQGPNAGESLITPLMTDDGDAFNNQLNNYTVDAGGQKLNSALNVAQAQEFDLTVPAAQQVDTLEGADTIRFTSAGTLDLGKGSTYKDSTGTYTGDGFLYMTYGGIMVAQGVTGDTAITNGTLLNNRDQFGMDFLNYSSGTLTIAASLAEASGTYQQGNDRTDNFSFGGGGKIILAGDNSTIAPGSSIYINSGVVQLANNNALGIDNRIVMGDTTSAIDLNGNSVRIGYLTSDGNMMPGNEAAAAGLNTQIENTAAGTISRLTIEGYTQPQATNSNGYVAVGSVNQGVNLGTYYGGLNEVSGSIISLDLEQGTATSEVQFDLGTSSPYGDPNGVNVSDASENAGPATSITGAIIIGANANLGLVDYGNVTTLGVTKLDGEMGAAGQQEAYYATTYLTGTGAVVPGYGYWGFDLNPVGSAADTFAGNFGQSNDNNSNNGHPSMTLITSGTGAIDFANEIYDLGVETEGTTTLTTPGIGFGGVSVGESSTLNITGSSGTVLGTNTGSIQFNGGTINIAPASPGPDVVVSGGATGFQVGGGGIIDAGTLILDNGGGTNSLTLQLGNTSSGFGIYNGGEFSIGSVQGLSSLGTTDRVVALSSNGGPASLPNGILGPGDYAQNDAPGSSRNATFLAYSGTGAASDAGFEAYTFAPANIDNLNNTGTYDSVNLIDKNYTYSAGNDSEMVGLEIDNGATLDVTGGLEIGQQDLGFGSLILNGGHITGNGLSISRILDIYTSLDNGYISSISSFYGNLPIAKNGPGTLFVGNLNVSGSIIINDGALDVTSVNSQNWGEIVLNGGVIQTNGSAELELSNGRGDLEWNQGGFSARGGELTVTIVDSKGEPTSLVWGTTAGFLGQGAVMQFGSTSADNYVDFQTDIDLGATVSGQQAAYSRVIDVTANSSDSGDPLLYQDYAFIYGNISSSNPYVGLAKAGNGVLVLFGDNTYTGATTIAEGTLVINADDSVGMAPTAAYALNTTPGLNGGALTPGAIEINGGASLAVENGYSVQSYYANDVVLNSNRQILLAGGTTGQTASIINIQGDPLYGYSELDFGGVIADYVGEVGSLEKQGGGIFNYSGVAANTGSYAVSAGTFIVSGAGSINSGTGVTINTSANADAPAQFNYQSTVGLSKAVTYGAGGGTFAYNSGALYTGSTSLVVGAKDTLAGGVGGLGNLSHTDVTIGTGGTILPGSQDPSPGQLTVGKLSLMEGGNYNFLLQNAQLAGLPPDAQYNPVGPGYSTVVATSLDLSGLSSSNPFNINLESLAGQLGPEPDRFYYYLPYTFTLVSTTDGITGAFNAADFDIITDPNNGTTGFDMLNGGQWTVAESGNGNNLLLVYAPTQAPEPSTWALLLGGLTLLGVVIRCARRQVA